MFLALYFDICKIMISFMDIGEPNLKQTSKQVNCGPSYDTNSLQRTNFDS